MSLLVSWVVFPLVLAALATGCGLLVERAAGVRLPGALVPGAGLALIVVVAELATQLDATAELAAPLVVICTVAGGLLYLATGLLVRSASFRDALSLLPLDRFRGAASEREGT